MKIDFATNKILDFFLGKYINHSIKNILSKYLLNEYLVFGDKTFLEIASTAIVNNALFNLSSGKIMVEDYVFFGHNVSLLTGSHDYRKFELDRQLAVPKSGMDILIKRGAWVASNVTILGPCIVGEHSVIAAGSVVKENVPSYTIVAGIPAKVIKHIKDEKILENS
jgi:acetyltransferase-like isoleucine patch superfamily enzyme